MTVYSAPGHPDSLVSLKSRYGHYIGGEWVEPVQGAYFENISPVNGRPFTTSLSAARNRRARSRCSGVSKVADALRAAIHPAGVSR